MPNRPSIPAEIARKLLNECGHRCAVCGEPLPLEKAHIIPWRECKQHKAEDLICLCANDHQRADSEKWGEKTLREYKERPWVLRRFGSHDQMPEHTAKVVLTIEMELRHFDETTQDWIRYAIAAFLNVSPHHVRITSVKEGSVKVTIELPAESAGQLLNAHETKAPELFELLAPIELSHVKKVDIRKLYESIVDKLYQAIYRLAYHKLSDTIAAQDIVQEVFLRLWKEMKSGTEILNFKTWAYTVAKRLIIDHIRKAYRTRQIIEAGGVDSNSERILATVASNSEEALIINDLYEALDHCLPKFQPRVRGVLLAYLNGWNIQQISKILEMDQNFVNNTWTRNRMKLLSCIRRKFPEIGDQHGQKS